MPYPLQVLTWGGVGAAGGDDLGGCTQAEVVTWVGEWPHKMVTAFDLHPPPHMLLDRGIRARTG